MPSHSPARATAVTLLLAALWLAGLVGPPVALLRVRSDWLARLEAPEEQARWDAFREAMKQQSGREGPVQRKVPKSTEPPLKVWLRDYAWLAIAAWVVLGGALGFVAMVLVRGTLQVESGVYNIRAREFIALNAINKARDDNSVLRSRQFNFSLEVLFRTHKICVMVGVISQETINRGTGLRAFPRALPASFKGNLAPHRIHVRLRILRKQFTLGYVFGNRVHDGAKLRTCSPG